MRIPITLVRERMISPADQSPIRGQKLNEINSRSCKLLPMELRPWNPIRGPGASPLVGVQGQNPRTSASVVAFGSRCGGSIVGECGWTEILEQVEAAPCR